MHAMTSKERIIAALEGEPCDRPPFCPFLAYVWENYPQEIQDAGQPAFLRSVEADPLWRGAPCPVKVRSPAVERESVASDGSRRMELGTPVGTLRMVWTRSPDGNTSFLTEHPLKTLEDLKIMAWIEEHSVLELNHESVEKHLAGAGREGLSLGQLLPRGKSSFQTLIEHSIGTQEMAYLLADTPEAVEALLEPMVANDLRAAKLSSESGFYGYFITWEDSSTQNYSPTQYRKYIASEIRQWCALLRSNGQKYIQHACGHLKDLLPIIADSGIFAVESLSPPPTGNISLKDARTLLGSVGIIGGIEPTKLLWTSESDLPAYAEEVLRDGGGGPFVLANSDSCPPGVNPEKFRAISRTAAQFHK